MITTIPIAVYHSAYGSFSVTMSKAALFLAHVLFLSGVSSRSCLCHQPPGPGRRSWVSAVSKERWGGLGEGWQVLVFNLLRGTQLPPGAFYQWVPIQADVIRLGRYCPLGKKKKQMFSEYVTGQDQFSLGLAWRTRNHLCWPLELEACHCTQMAEWHVLIAAWSRTLGIRSLIFSRSLWRKLVVSHASFSCRHVPSHKHPFLEGAVNLLLPLISTELK